MANMEQFIIYDGNNRDTTYSVSIHTHNDQIELTANTPVTYVVPTGAYQLLFGCVGGSFYAKWGAAAPVITGTILDGEAGVPDPALVYVTPGETQITVVAPQNCILSISAYTK